MVNCQENGSKGCACVVMGHPNSKKSSCCPDEIAEGYMSPKPVKVTDGVKLTLCTN